MSSLQYALPSQAGAVHTRQNLLAIQAHRSKPHTWWKHFIGKLLACHELFSPPRTEGVGEKDSHHSRSDIVITAKHHLTNSLVGAYVTLLVITVWQVNTNRAV